MNSGVRGTSFDGETFSIVVINKVEYQPQHSLGDIAAKAGRLPAMVSLVLPNLSIEVVRSEQGIGIGFRQRRGDCYVGDAMFLILGAPKA